MTAGTLRVVCLSTYCLFGLIASACIQVSIASKRLPTSGTLWTGASMSPRETSISSVSVSVTLIGGNASATSLPPAVRTCLTFERTPDGRATTSSPGRTTPEAIVPQ